MKKIIFLAATCIVCTNAHAQTAYSIDRYSSAVTQAPNGFRTVSEEDALMEKAVAERRRIAKQEENNLSEEDQKKANEQQAAIVRERLAVATRSRSLTSSK